MWPRWIRAAATIWVAWDSRQRKSPDLFWILVILLLGPLLLPFYLATRPLAAGEYRRGGLLWNLFLSFEKLASWVVGLAAAAVLIENMTLPPDKDIAEIRRAEIKAGSILGLVAIIMAAGLEKIGFGIFRKHIEDKHFS